MPSPKGRFGRELQAGTLEPAFPVAVSVEDGEDSDGDEGTTPAIPEQGLPERYNTLQKALLSRPVKQAQAATTPLEGTVRLTRVIAALEAKAV